MNPDIYDCWYLDWHGKEVGKEPVIRATIEGFDQAIETMHEKLRGLYYSPVQQGNTWLFYSNMRSGLIGMMTRKR